MVDSIAVRRVWQQFSRLNPSVYNAALCGGCCVPPCVADVSIVNCAVCQQFNKRTLLLLGLLLLLSCVLDWCDLHFNVEFTDPIPSILLLLPSTGQRCFVAYGPRTLLAENYVRLVQAEREPVPVLIRCCMVTDILSCAILSAVVIRDGQSTQT